AAYTRFDKNSFEWSFADVMSGRPPRLHLFHKDSERPLQRHIHAYRLTYDDFLYGVWHFSLPSVVFLLLPEIHSRPWSTSGQSGRAAVLRPRDSTGRASEFRTYCR